VRVSARETGIADPRPAQRAEADLGAGGEGVAAQGGPEGSDVTGAREAEGERDVHGAGREIEALREGQDEAEAKGHPRDGARRDVGDEGRHDAFEQARAERDAPGERDRLGAQRSGA
jgi:hypothetical protein